jgi:hypothetical protein
LAVAWKAVVDAPAHLLDGLEPLTPPALLLADRTRRAPHPGSANLRKGFPNFPHRYTGLAGSLRFDGWEKLFFTDTARPAKV